MHTLKLLACFDPRSIYTLHAVRRLTWARRHEPNELFLTTTKRTGNTDDENARTISAGISASVPSRANVSYANEWACVGCVRVEDENRTRREFSFLIWKHFMNVTLNGGIFERIYEKKGVVCNEMRFNPLTFYLWSCSIDLFCQILFFLILRHCERITFREFCDFMKFEI